MLTLQSPAFAAGAPIPPEHTCDGADTSPALSWHGAPAGTRSLALIVDEPDAPDPAAPKRTWVHWVLYDLPPSLAALPAGVHTHALPAGTRQGLNDWQRAGYGGPCPPSGVHHYHFTLSALDVATLGLQPGATKADVEKAMQGHVLGTADLVGLYQRQPK